MDDKWVRVAASDAVTEGNMLQVDVGGEAVCLFNLGGTLYATQDVCTHEHAFLSEGFIDGDCIECPLHQALFHIPTGEVRGAPATENLRVYPVRVVGANIEVNNGDSPVP
jgi:nitrite reductase/ring-hydroxylating ferredoxin subunit